MIDELPVTIVKSGSVRPEITRKKATQEPLSEPTSLRVPAKPVNPRTQGPRGPKEKPMLEAFEKAARILAASSELLTDAEKLARVQAIVAPYKDELYPAPVVVEAPAAAKVRKPRGKVTDPAKLERMRAVAAKARAARAAKLAAQASSLV